MHSFEKEIDELRPWELRRFVLALLEQTEASAEGTSTPLLQRWEETLASARQSQQEEEARRDQVHLVFSQSDAGAMKVALSNLGRRLESRVLAFDTLFSLGPLDALEETEGQQRRNHWFIERFPCYLHYSFHHREHQIGAMLTTLADIPAEKRITIWHYDNAHDQTALRFVLHLLRHKRNPIRIVNGTRAYASMAQSGDPGQEPIAQGEIPFESLQAIVQGSDALPLLTERERRRFEAEWLELSGAGSTLRIWRDGAIQHVPEHYFDEPLLALIDRLQSELQDASFVHAGRAAGEALMQWKQLVGDSFIDYRLWTLIGQGRLQFQGLPGALFRYRIRRA
ncbi:DUF1835 domain-containing protein [Paenibacillus sp. TAB 01]|uniref:DUF1835 domain-containing protein n=1 Tax=Paenibacillus sp. TAB 01 TaxID=3368988 RepID=UPI0037516985